MRILAFGGLAFAVIFGGGLLGLLLSRRLPESYNDAGTRAVVTTAMRTVSLLSALVLGLLVATAKNKFDSNNAQTERFAADVMSLNRELVNYGPDAADIRALLHRYVVAKTAAVWPSLDGAEASPGRSASLAAHRRGAAETACASSAVRRAARDAVGRLADRGRLYASDLAAKGAGGRSRASAVRADPLGLAISSVRGNRTLFAPRNAVTVTALLVTALSIASAIALIDDLDAPYRGFVVVFPQPMQRAIAEISAPVDGSGRMAEISPSLARRRPMSTPFQISLAPEQLWQAINPMTFYQQGAQFGLINIDLGAAAESDLERKLLDRVGSYGRQLGRIGDALEVILKHVKLGELNSDEQDALDILKGQLAAVRQVKAERRTGTQLTRRARLKREPDDPRRSLRTQLDGRWRSLESAVGFESGLGSSIAGEVTWRQRQLALAASSSGFFRPRKRPPAASMRSK